MRATQTLRLAARLHEFAPQPFVVPFRLSQEQATEVNRIPALCYVPPRAHSLSVNRQVVVCLRATRAARDTACPDVVQARVRAVLGVDSESTLPLPGYTRCCTNALSKSLSTPFLASGDIGQPEPLYEPSRYDWLNKFACKFQRTEWETIHGWHSLGDAQYDEHLPSMQVYASHTYRRALTQALKVNQ